MVSTFHIPPTRRWAPELGAFLKFAPTSLRMCADKMLDGEAHNLLAEVARLDKYIPIFKQGGLHRRAIAAMATVRDRGDAANYVRLDFHRCADDEELCDYTCCREEDFADGHLHRRGFFLVSDPGPGVDRRIVAVLGWMSSGPKWCTNDKAVVFTTDRKGCGGTKFFVNGGDPYHLRREGRGQLISALDAFKEGLNVPLADYECNPQEDEYTLYRDLMVSV